MANGLSKDQVLDLWADVIGTDRTRLRQVADVMVDILGLTAPADPFAAMIGMGQVEATRFLAAGLAKVNGGEVCQRCGGTGRYGGYGVCFDCGGRRWL